MRGTSAGISHRSTFPSPPGYKTTHATSAAFQVRTARTRHTPRAACCRLHRTHRARRVRRACRRRQAAGLGAPRTLDTLLELLNFFLLLEQQEALYGDKSIGIGSGRCDDEQPGGGGGGGRRWRRRRPQRKGMKARGATGARGRAAQRRAGSGAGSGQRRPPARARAALALFSVCVERPMCPAASLWNLCGPRWSGGRRSHDHRGSLCVWLVLNSEVN